MKIYKHITTIILFFIAISVTAQQSINYKALIKDGSGNVVANQSITVQFKILQGGGLTNVYQETHTPTTDANGIIIINIGEGIVDSGVYANIDWGSDDHFLNVQINTGGGLTDMGSTQFMAVPYALNAANAATKVDDLSDGKSDNNGSSVFLGVDAGLNDDGSDNNNVGVGFNTLYSNITGAYNTAIGYLALESNTNGVQNTATGVWALRNNIGGNENTAIGLGSLSSNTFGNQNTASGSGSLSKNTEGGQNTANGYATLFYNIDGNNNTASGYAALSSNLAGDDNTATGFLSLYSNTDGIRNTANGANALYSNNSGFYNTADGFGALYSNTEGENNTANGANALYFNDGDYNTANGANALYWNTIGFHNTANGGQALVNNISGNYNTANGYQALVFNSTGYENTANGYKALYKNNGVRNTANGYQSLYSNLTGNYNTATGYKALYSKTTGNWNSAFGRQALSNLISGTNNIGIGYNAQTSSTTASNEVTVGNSSNNVYRMYAASWTNASDRQLKHAIQNIPVGLDLVLKLRPVEFIYNNANNEQKTFGFIAQEVKEAVKQSNLEDDILVSPLNKKYLGLRTTELISVLTKAIQEQQEIIESQNNEIKFLSFKLSKTENEQLTVKSRLTEIESKLKSNLK